MFWIIIAIVFGIIGLVIYLDTKNRLEDIEYKQESFKEYVTTLEKEGIIPTSKELQK